MKADVVPSTLQTSARFTVAQLAASPSFYLPLLLNAGRQRLAEVLGVSASTVDAIPLPEISLLLLALVSVLVIAQAGQQQKSFGTPSTALILTVMIWLWLLASLFWTKGPSIGVIKVIQLSIAMGEVLLAVWLLRGPQALLHFASGYVCFAAVLAVASVVQWDGSRLSALGGGSNMFGRFMFSGIVSAFYLMRELRSNYPVRLALVRLSLAVLASSFAALMLMTGSRGVVVSAATTVGLVYIAHWIAGNRQVRRSGVSWWVYVLVGGVLVGVALSHLPLVVSERYYSFFIDGEIGGTGLKRLDMAAVAFGLFKMSPLLGVGVGGYSALTAHPYPHNWFVELMVEGGLMTLLAGVAFVLLALTAGARLTKSAPSAAGLLVSLMLFALMAAQFSGDVFDNRLILVYGNVIFAVARHRTLR